MPQRDYAARSNKNKGLNKSLILGIIIFLLLAGGISLWVLKENAPTPIIPATQQHQPVQPQGPALPSRPEEVYSYIRDLETREVLTDNTQKSQEKLAQLSAEQKQQLEAKLKQEEQARIAAENPAPKSSENTTADATTDTQTPPSVVALTPEELEAKKLAEQQKMAKLAEEKRKQAELKKQQELAKQKQATTTAETVKSPTPAEQKAKTAAEQAKAEPKTTELQAKTESSKKVEQPKKEEQPKKAEQPKIIATAAKPSDKPSAQAGKFGLQCGAFKNKAQAENMQARLAMAGFNARISSSSDWNRVFVGPVGDRAAASTAQSNARSVAECVIISM
ncbi:SPOR domain-containing protein [Actinobacillus genomosp. 2]|uniref:SPOR domain-containing protein n=1 Tax=Actinobacillus genomosp. 2 TaxID=230709 RepID=UPI002441DFB1|nr:SPOR domain-containing protein [Actinobacillus genomosp. 2]WGE31450.1 SPOR domain-containing protein [Actinobacillus genomosp. 2]